MCHKVKVSVIMIFICLMTCSTAYSKKSDFINSRSAQKDYTFIWWSQGWPGRISEADPVVCLQTGHFGMSINVFKVNLSTFGKFNKNCLPQGIVSDDNSAVFELPEAALDVGVWIDGKRYTCVGSSEIKENVYVGSVGSRFRIINSGRFVQRVDIQGLQFKDENGNLLDAVGRLEIVAWPDIVSFILELTPGSNLANVTINMNLVQKGIILASTSNINKSAKINKGEILSQSLSWSVSDQSDDFENQMVQAQDQELNQTLKVDLDKQRNWFHVQLPEKNWHQSHQQSKTEKIKVSCRNHGQTTKRFRLCFEASYLGAMTGLVPVICDVNGNPTGLSVQISKNWHKTTREGQLIDPILYQGDWFQGFTILDVPPNSEIEFELLIVCGLWGTVPAASHAQLCLIGWGINQLWDQAAIGNWGESICYDPDVNLSRSMIDDIRPLMVWPMRPEKKKWDWTNNVGGGDFLVYYDQNNVKRPLVRMKTFYDYVGPNLTKVMYSGITDDGKISADLTVMSPRCEDINRVFHKVRYTVNDKTRFSRLAFYQLGADNYNDHQFDKVARGNRDSLIEEWAVKKGGSKYHREYLPCKGTVPWFSLHEAVNRFEHGATANRGLIIRHWKARLSGKEVAYPYASLYGTENQYPSSNIELVPSPKTQLLLPGDYIEFIVEIVIIPQFEADYYGPSPFLKHLLKTGENTYKPVFEMAQKNNIKCSVTRGKLISQWPLTIQVDQNESAEFRMEGGASYLPVEFRGLSQYTGYELLQIVEGKAVKVDQSNFGNDFWQTEYDLRTGKYSRIYNVQFNRYDSRKTSTVWKFQKNNP